MKILVANRGEIARRIMRTAHRLGHETVAVYADPDRDAPFVSEATTAIRIGPASLAESYLSIERIMGAARKSGATAVHPGYGFLSENEPFARTCVAGGLTWIGPSPDVIAKMGSKIEARRLAAAAGVPVIPGWSESQEPTALSAAATKIGYPVLIKASAGGGGKGIRIARDIYGFGQALGEASSEAKRSFGDGSVIVERYIQRPRHIEVQIIADRHGTVAELGTRECSVQRRYQKLLEEAPASNLPVETHRGIRTSASRLAQAMGYDSAGTVEFIVDDATGEYFFLEMNTRLQVEHPVTELITGVDLVELMIRVAAGERLPLDAAQLRFTGHAFEARILAEDAGNNFAPQIGTVHHVSIPDGVRWDTAIEPGSEISPHYDSMIAKLIVHGATRDDALAKLRAALEGLVIGGVTTTAGFHRWLIDQEPIVNASVTTRFLDETPIPASPPPAIDVAASVWGRALDAATTSDTPWRGSPISITPHVAKRSIGFRALDGELHETTIPWGGAADSGSMPAAVVDLAGRRISVNVAGHTHSFEVPTRTERWAPSRAGRRGSGDALVAPFPAVVSEVHVAPGDAVQGDQVLVVIEAMKMLHSLRCTGTAIVSEVRVAAGDQIATGDVLVAFEPSSEESDKTGAESEEAPE